MGRYGSTRWLRGTTRSPRSPQISQISPDLPRSPQLGGLPRGTTRAELADLFGAYSLQPETLSLAGGRPEAPNLHERQHSSLEAGIYPRISPHLPRISPDLGPEKHKT